MLGYAGLWIFLVLPSTGLKASRQNAAADAVVKYGIALGIDPNPDDANADHPKPADALAYERANAPAWLSEQIEEESDQIGEPPEELRRFLSDRETAIWALVAALEKNPPEWEEPPEGPPQGGRPVWPLLSVRLTRLLLAEALVADRDGDSIAPGRTLEAVWSLVQPLAVQGSLYSQIVATAMEKLQAGVLRKLKDPPLDWLSRMAGNGPWGRMLAAIREATSPKGLDRVLGPDASDRPYWKLTAAMNESLARVSPCELAGRSEEEIDRLIDDVLSTEASGDAKEAAAIRASIMFPNLLSAARRAGRTEIDREMTLRILELRLEKDSSVNGRWPQRLLAQTSDVCAGVEYAYRADKTGIELRFQGTINPPTSVPAVPLVFRSRQPVSPTPTVTFTPTPRAVLTPTPAAHRLLGR